MALPVTLIVFDSSCGVSNVTSEGGVLAILGGASPSNLTYSQNPAIYNASRAIPTNTPAFTGTVSLFTVAPPLPVGLAINPATGAIDGTPAAVARPNVYTVTASNSFGFTTAALTIRIVPFNFEFDRN